MKNKLILLLIILSLGLIESLAQNKTKYYILFDNFEDQKAGDVTITNLIDLCYWDPMSTDVIFGPYCERAPFSAATFNKRDITEYDVAVFPMGTSLGLDAQVDGIRVIDKIEQMIKAGKSVMIIGNAVLLNGFGPNASQKTKEFLRDFMGIDYPISNKYIENGRLKLTSGNTIFGAYIDGKEGDPVSKGFDKVINQQYNLNNGGFRPPIRYYLSIDVFKIRPGSKAVAFDQVSVVWNDSLDKKTYEMYTGVRREEGTARVALWTTNFDIANTWHTLHYTEALMGGFEWATNDIPRPEKYILAENMQVNFGKVEPGSKGYKSIAFQNFGRTPLTVKKSTVADLEEPGIFTIIEGGGSVKLNPLEIHTLNVQFTPKSPKTYTDAIDVESDATNGMLSIELYGIGGDKVEHGPKIQVTDLPVNFGTVPYTEYSEKQIGISSVGDQDLVVEKLEFLDDANKFFSFPKIMKVPITIKPGTTYYFVVRFTPLDSNGGSYTGKIYIESNGLNQGGKAIIELVAKGAPKATTSNIKLSATEIDYGTVYVGDSSVFNLRITNGGANDLMVSQVKMEGGGESRAQYKFLNGSENIPNLPPNASHEVLLQFKPAAAKTYEVNIKIVSNDPVAGVLNIPVKGKGEISSSVENSLDKVFSLSINPNIISGNAILSYDYTGESGKHISLKIVDILGNIRKEVYNGIIFDGLHLINLGNLDLENGKYFVIAEVDSYIKQVPFIINK